VAKSLELKQHVIAAVNRYATQNLHRRACPIIIPQRADDIFNFILLEEADGGDSGGAGVQAGTCVLECDAPQGENWNFRPAGFAQSAETGGGTSYLFEYRGEDCNVGPFGFGAQDIFSRVTGPGDHWPFAGGGARATIGP